MCYIRTVVVSFPRLLHAAVMAAGVALAKWKGTGLGNDSDVKVEIDNIMFTRHQK